MSNALPQLSIGKNFDRRQMGERSRTHTGCMTIHVVKYSHHPEQELTYNIVLAHVLIVLDLRAIHFKFHDQIKHCLISFQSVTLGTTQDDKHLYA
jgi:hypothetical protein